MRYLFTEYYCDFRCKLAFQQEAFCYKLILIPVHSTMGS